MALGQPRVGLAGWFVYPLTLTLTASIGSVDEDQIQVYYNSDFEIHSIQFFDTGSNNGQFSVKWGTANVFFMPDFTLAPNIFGQGNLVHVFPQPIVFPRGSTIVFSLRNESANSRTIFLAVEGININVTT